MLLRTGFTGGNPAKTGAFRCSTPGVRAIRATTGIFFWLFMLKTGWNPSTVAGIDVLDPDGWSRPHPQSDIFSVIHAWKGRADRHQFTISLIKPKWHPYGIVKFMVERTAVLRRQVLADLAEARRRAASDPALDLRREIAELDRMSRSPWLFATRSMGTISALGSANSFLLQLARSVVDRHGLAEADDRLAGIVARDARTAWIGYAYVNSRYHLLLTKLAGNHGSLRTTRHYTRSMRYRAYSEGQVRKLQDALFSEVGDGRILDPTRLRMLVENGSITPDQEKRLADHRQRTSLGMGCLDPTAPPRQIDPDHRDGALCRIQRCTGCPQGIVFPESMPSLARRQAELEHLRRTMPMAAWEGSSLADESASVEQTLLHFDAGSVEAEVAAWMKKLASGEAVAHGTYPSY